MALKLISDLICFVLFQWQEKLEEDMALFTREFEQLRKFEEEQKGLFLGQLKALQRELEEAKKSIADCFTEKFDYLSTQIRNNEELCQKTGIQFLQVDICNGLLSG